MHFIAHFLFFVCIVILYLHTMTELKTSEDLEIYELDYQTKQHLQDICDARQPILFQFKLPFPTTGINGIQEFLPENSPFDVVCVQNKSSETETTKPTKDVLLKMPYKSCYLLMKTDTEGQYISYHNEAFVDEATLAGYYYKLDKYLKPPLTVVTHYDLLFGSKNAVTPLMYHFYNERFLMVASGKIRVKMTPWKSKRYLDINKNIETLDFTASINLWNPSLQDKTSAEKIKCLEFDIQTGYIVYIPAYWFYTIQYLEENTLVPSITYNTATHYIANALMYVNHYKYNMHKMKPTLTLE
jgi:hypothetical protein